VRPFDGDLEEYRRLLLDRAAAEESKSPERPDRRREARRRTAAQRRLVDPLRLQQHRAEETISRLTAERDALDRELAGPGGSRAAGSAISGALKRRAELVRSIGEAEAEWLALEEAVDRAASQASPLGNCGKAAKD
jgi:ATP-binding cassette, subfamily F, member 3